MMDFQEIFRHVDHTVLAACSTWEDVRKLCDEAAEYGTASVCIPPAFVKRAKEAYPQLAVCTVIGFPLGYSTTAVKVFEAQDALASGADEVDMVVNLGWVKQGDFESVTDEIRQLKAACGERILKVIVETCYLTQDEKQRLCQCVTQAGADFIKTSTGFGTAGATVEDIRLFKAHIGPGVRMKASGGIRSYEDCVRYLQEGCDRLGTSSAVAIYKSNEGLRRPTS